MKKILFVVFFIVSSCTTIKQLKNQDTQSIEGSASFVENKNLILLNTLIDGNKSILMFDTGATMSVIFDSTAVPNFETKDFGTFGTVTGIDGTMTDLKTFTANFENEIFKSEKKAFAFINKIGGKCAKESNYKGIIGLDVFFKNNQNLYLNFSDKTINNISDEQLNKLIKNDFYKIKSECGSNKIFIYLTINNIEFKFKLDTGFSGNFAIPYNKNLNFNDFQSLEYEGSLFSTANSTTNGLEKFYEKIPVKIGNENLFSTILVSTAMKNHNVGIQFIKGFDWIIDYKNNSVYIKKNNNEVKSLNNEKAFKYMTIIKNDKLLISAKLKKDLKFKINDQIISINDAQVNNDNICEMQKLLNSTADWSNLKIEVLSSK